MTPNWEANSSGQFKLIWTSPDDLVSYIGQVVAPAAKVYGFRIVLERIPAEEPRVDRPP